MASSVYSTLSVSHPMWIFKVIPLSFYLPSLKQSFPFTFFSTYCLHDRCLCPALHEKRASREQDMAHRVCMRLLLLPELQPGRRDDENKGSGRSGPTRRINHTWGTPNKKTQNSTLDATGLQQRKRELNNPISIV